MKVRQILVRYIAGELDFSLRPADTIIHDRFPLFMVSARWAPQMPPPERKTNRKIFSGENLKLFCKDQVDFITQLLTSDDT